MEVAVCRADVLQAHAQPLQNNLYPFKAMQKLQRTHIYNTVD